MTSLLAVGRRHPTALSGRRPNTFSPLASARFWSSGQQGAETGRDGKEAAGEGKESAEGSEGNEVGRSHVEDAYGTRVTVYERESFFCSQAKTLRYQTRE